MVPLFLHSGSFGCHESPEASALVGVVSMEVGVSFAARRERYTSGSGPFSRLREYISNSLLTIQLPINKLSSGPCSQGHPDCPLLLYTGLQKRDM